MVSSNILKCCRLCPRECCVDRTVGEKGFCRAEHTLRVAKASLHPWEEPCISGSRGSGTIFFSLCNLSCVFCQNYTISQENTGKDITQENFVEICLSLQEQGAHNINLVSPTPYISLLRKGLQEARRRGLVIPIVYNTNSYEKIASLQMLEGLVDVYLPDLKYFAPELGKAFSGVDDYFFYASQAVLEMFRQVGEPVFEQNGTMQKGLLIRHLILPGLIKDTKHILTWVAENLPREVYISIMGQYTPVYRAQEFSAINRTLTRAEYAEVIEYFFTVGLENGFGQELDSADDLFIPDFDLSGV